jgi:hypothetical protein
VAHLTSNDGVIEDGMGDLKALENFIAGYFRGRVNSSAFLLGLTIVLSSCGGSSNTTSTPATPPSVTISANPTSITTGSSTTLTVTATNATQVVLTDNAGDPAYTFPTATGGTDVVSPTANVTYTATATGASGATATNTVSVTVNGPSVTISANPASITTGSSTTLTVTATNATQVVLTDNVGDPAYTFPAATGGTDVVSPTANVTYTATATGANGDTATNTVSVTVNGPSPTMTSFSATPAAILAGQSITLSWTSQNADYVVINASVGPSPGRVAANATNYALPAPTQTTTYSAVATTNAGQQSVPSTFMVSVNPITSFNGMDASQAEGGTTEDDIDPNGAVGDYQFLEYTNTSYQGYDKTSFAPVWSAAQPMGTPWPTGTHCAGTQIQLDAVIIFDRIAKRWVMGAKTTVQGQGGFYFCIAVSNTDDLTSTNPPFAWYAYSFRLDPYLQNSTNTVTYLPDWPKLATWPEANNPAYYAAMDTVNTVNNAQTENGVLVCAFDRTDMLTGAPQNSLKPMMCYQVKGPDTGGYLAHSLIPADVDGTTPPPTGRDEFMVSIQNPPIDNVSVSSPTINLWDFQLNWATPSFTLVGGAPSLVNVDPYQPGCYTAAFPAQTVCVPEQGVQSLGGGLFVDSVGDRLMPRFAYRNFGAYESFLVSHTVQSPVNGQAPQDSKQTGIRWYEFLDNGSGAPALRQQGTVTPDITTFRFLPSIAQDKMGNVAVGYSVSNPLSNPGINMSFWNLNDPSGPASAPTEITILDGSTVGEEIPYAFNANPPGISTLGQWGSYALMTVDPGDDCTFWYVTEYWPTTNLAGTPANWATNISNFQIPGCQ